MIAKRLLFLLFTIPFTFFSCSDDPAPRVEEKALVEAVQIGSRSAQEIQLLIGFYNPALNPANFKYNVNTYRVKYRSTYKGEPVIASGVISVPQTQNSISTISFHHGTIVQHSEAPSALDDDDPEIILMELMASAGFMTVVPDYFGFGESKELLHPYYAEEPTATAVLDNLLASRDFADDKNVSLNNDLFLAGYSQGGYTTLAAHKAIEERDFDAFNLIASFPAAGGYDLEAMQRYFFRLPQYHQPFYMAYVAMSYATYYDYNTFVSDFFNEPYASRIPTLFDGLNAQGFINSQLTQEIPVLIREDILQNIDVSDSYAYIREAFRENSLTDWIPQHPVYFYHGDQDDTVPYENTLITVERLRANGTPEDRISLTVIPGADHATGVEPYLNDLLIKLQQLDAN